MDLITAEKATYVISYFSDLLTAPEKQALRHHRSTIKSEGQGNEKQVKLYYKTGWLSDDPEILNYLKDGYEQFIINCTSRIFAG